MNLELTINTDKVRNSSEEKLLGVTFAIMTFHVLLMLKRCAKRLSKKLHALLYRVCNYMTLSHRRIIMKAFIESQFDYCPIVWIFHGNRNLNNTMNNIQD